MLADGRLHLTAITRLAPYLTDENRDGLLERATYRSKRQILELIAEIAPLPDVPAVVRKLPERRALPTPPVLVIPSGGESPMLPPGPQPMLELCPDRVAPPAWASVVQPLSPGRYKVQFTASAEFHHKLERLRALLGSGAPDGDVAAVIEQAVTEKLERLEARRFARTVSTRKHPAQAATQRESLAKTAAPRGASGEPKMQTEPEASPTSRYIPAAVRRAVCERDGNRCRYVDAQGRRCPERNRLEFHHRRPFGLGGEHSVSNIGLACHAHNAYLADCDFGREAMASHRRARSLPSQVGAARRE
jgi:hypothetical protein